MKGHSYGQSARGFDRIEANVLSEDEIGDVGVSSLKLNRFSYALRIYRTIEDLAADLVHQRNAPWPGICSHDEWWTLMNFISLIVMWSMRLVM